MHRSGNRYSKGSSSDQERSKLKRTILDQIFYTFGVVYKDRFYSKFGDETQLREEKALWSSSDLVFFAESEIATALDKLKNEFAWPPNLAEFIRFCEECSDFLSVEEAYRQACVKHLRDLDMITCVAAVKTGTFELKGRPYDESWPRFKKNYLATLKRYRSGENVEGDIPKLLENKQEEFKPASKDKARNYLRELREKLKG